jgi:PHD/YefM family antitoxin component YafN of YafNO toxin-antitoxin module
MFAANERYVIDGQGNRVAVLLDVADYHELLEELEELDALRAYDAARASRDEAIPLEKALAEIEHSRS